MAKTKEISRQRIISTLIVVNGLLILLIYISTKI